MATMTLLPIVERELRAAARRPSLRLVWLMNVVIPVAVGGVFLYGFGAMISPSAMARSMFESLSWWLFMVCIMAGTRVTSDCLSEEKRSGTLGLLFLTDLKGYDVALGKLVSSSLRVVYGLIAALPVLAIPVTVGGIAFGEFACKSLALLNVLFFSLAAGMFISSISRDERRAMSATLVLLIFSCGYPGIVAGVYHYFQIPGEPSDYWFWACPWYPFTRSFVVGYSFAAGIFWYPLLITHLLGWFFIGMASWILPRVWQDKAASIRREAHASRWKIWLHGSAANRTHRREKMLDRNPIYWLAGASGLPRTMTWAFLGLVTAIWILADQMYDISKEPPAYIITAILLHSTFKFWIASQAGVKFAQDRLSGALELILATPIAVKTIVWGQLRALGRQFFMPTLAVVLVDLVMLFAGIDYLSNDGEVSHWIWAFITGITVFLADMITMTWLGMWLGMSVRKSNMIAGTAGFRLLVVPFVLWFLSVIFYGVDVARTTPNSSPDPRISEWLYLLISLSFAVFWSVWSGVKLFKQFRTRATDRYQPPRKVWWKPWVKPAVPLA